jgi:hypothetical protein
MTAGPLVQCDPWLKPIRDYDRRQDMQFNSFTKYG